MRAWALSWALCVLTLAPIPGIPLHQFVRTLPTVPWRPRVACDPALLALRGGAAGAARAGPPEGPTDITGDGGVLMQRLAPGNFRLCALSVRGVVLILLDYRACERAAASRSAVRDRAASARSHVRW
jgi:hypothetical protein